MFGSGRGLRSVGAALVTAVLALALGACSGGTDKKGGGAPTSSGGPVRATVHWDLRKSHSAKQVKWRGSSMVDLEGGVQVKIQLPGRTFQDRVDRFGAFKANGQVADISVYYPGTSIAAAYTQARRLAQEWKCDTKPLDTWYANEKAHSDPPGGLTEALATSIGQRPTGPGGPEPSAEILYSFDDSKPAMVKFTFSWGF